MKTFTVIVTDYELVQRLRWSHADKKIAKPFFEQLTRATFYDSECQINFYRENGAGKPTDRLAVYDKWTGTLVDFEKGDSFDLIVEARQRKEAQLAGIPMASSDLPVSH
jgi:hypothetical protein